MTEVISEPNAKGRTGRAWDPSRLAFLSSTLSVAFARNVYYLAASWILAERGYGSAGVATFLAVTSGVEFLASPIAGVMADRFDRRRLNAAADLGRFGVAFATPAALLCLDTLLAMCVSAAVYAFCERIALTAQQSMIPTVGEGRDPVAWNSAVFFTMQTGNLGGALVAGLMLGVRSPTLPFIALGIAFLLSAGLLASMNWKAQPHRPRSASGAAPLTEPRIFHLIVVYALFYASGLLVSVMGSSLVFAELRGTAADFGYFEAAWSVGSVAGAIALIRVHGFSNPRVRHLILLGLTGLFFMSLPILREGYAMMLFAFLGFLYNLGRVSVEVALQSHVGSGSLGRAKGLMHSAAVALGFVVFAIAAVVGDRVQPSTIFFSFGVMLLIAIVALAIGDGQPQEEGKS